MIRHEDKYELRIDVTKNVVDHVSEKLTRLGYVWASGSKLKWNTGVFDGLNQGDEMYLGIYPLSKEVTWATGPLTSNVIGRFGYGRFGFDNSFANLLMLLESDEKTIIARTPVFASQLTEGLRMVCVQVSGSWHEEFTTGEVYEVTRNKFGNLKITDNDGYNWSLGTMKNVINDGLVSFEHLEQPKEEQEVLDPVTKKIRDLRSQAELLRIKAERITDHRDHLLEKAEKIQSARDLLKDL